MKRTIIGITLLALAITAGAQAQAQEQQKGPRGGCYVVVKTKAGKTPGKAYKKYVPCKGVKK